MANTPETSFIPKQSMGRVPRRAVPRQSFNVFNFAATIIFLAVLVLSVGVYFYKSYVEAELRERKERLSALKDDFDQSDIQSLRELDNRIDTAQMLLDQHFLPSAVFDALERHTQSNVWFQSFLYNRNEEGSVAIELTAQAPRFNTVALQEQELDITGVLSNTVFSDLAISETDAVEGLSPEDTVSFRVTGLIDTDEIRYMVDLPPTEEDNATSTEEQVETESEDSSEDVATTTSPDAGTAPDDIGAPATSTNETEL